MDDNRGQNNSFHFYSWGIVAANKKRKSDTIEVTPIQDLPFTEGEITSSYKKINSNGIDSSGGEFQSEVKVTNTISATWIPIGQSNRFTSPDVRRGERVAIYRFSDQDKYYWITSAKEKKIRRLETVIYAFGATKQENVELNADNCYFLEISGHNRHITLKTSKANNELTMYTFQLNPGSGLATLRDSDGNQFNINTKEKRIEIIHATGPSIVLTETENTHRGGRHIFYNDIFVIGSIYATGVIIDDQGNTNHHGH